MTSADLDADLDEFLAVGAPVDLSNCEREPIHIPGSVQPHGVLLTLAGPDAPVEQVSDNCADILGVGPGEVLGRGLADLVSVRAHEVLAGAMTRNGTRTSGSPLRVPAPAGPRDRATTRRAGWTRWSTAAVRSGWSSSSRTGTT